MEEYDYDIEYVKSKENKVANCLFRFFPITSDILKQAIEIFGTPVITEDGVLKGEEKINLPPRRKRESSEETKIESTEGMTPEKLEMHTEFINGRLQPTFGKIKTKPNAIGKLWKEIKKEEMPDYDEEDWLMKLSWSIEEIKSKNLTIIRLIFGDPLFTPLQKEVLQEMMEFLSNYYTKRKSLHT